MLKGMKFRMYPNKEQRIQINKTLGCCRLVYNKFLSIRKDAYEKDGTKIGKYDTISMLVQMKKSDEYAFLKEADAIAMQQTLIDLDRAYTNFFRKNARYPRFKSVNDHRQTYRTIQAGIRVEGNKVKLPKLGFVKIAKSMEVPDVIKNATIERTPSGKYFVTLAVEFEPEVRPNKGGQIGLSIDPNNPDVFYTDSNGFILDCQKHYEKSMKRLVKEQVKLARMQEGSNNWKKQRVKLARAHEKIYNQRTDFLQKLTTQLISENQVICVEDFNVSDHVKGHEKTQALYSAAYDRFKNMLCYKADWYGNDAVLVSALDEHDANSASVILATGLTMLNEATA